MALQFGVHTGLHSTTVDDLRSLWRRIEDAGFDWISIWDHFYAADATGSAECLEAVSMHAALATTTSRVRCGSLVYSIGYRHPAVLANAIATIDHLSGGRATLGVGAGWHQLEYDAYGIPFPPVGVRMRQLEEGILCIRGLLTQPATTFAGDYFELTDARCEPRPVQRQLPLWVGGGGEKVTLRIVAQHADGWNVPFVPPEVFAHKVGVLEEHCERAGTDPAKITKAVNLGFAFDDAGLEQQFGRMAGFIGPGSLVGEPREIIDKIGAYRDAGADWVILAVRPPFDPDALDRFAAEVMPAFA